MATTWSTGPPRRPSIWKWARATRRSHHLLRYRHDEFQRRRPVRAQEVANALPPQAIKRAAASLVAIPGSVLRKWLVCRRDTLVQQMKDVLDGSANGHREQLVQQGRDLLAAAQSLAGYKCRLRRARLAAPPKARAFPACLAVCATPVVGVALSIANVSRPLKSVCNVGVVNWGLLRVPACGLTPTRGFFACARAFG